MANKAKNKGSAKAVMKLKTGFYQQYRFERQPVAAKGISFFHWSDERKALVKKILTRIWKAFYYIVLFFLCSVGASALLNAAIRKILIESLFG